MEKQRWEESERRSEKKEDAGARKGRKVAIHCVFQMICGSGCSKSRLAKAAGAEPCGQMRDYINIARRCGAKHICRSTCTKHTNFGPPLEVEMLKKWTPLWREAHFQVKMFKTPHARTSFDASYVVLRGRRKGLRTLSKVCKTWGFCNSCKSDIGRPVVC